MTDAKYSICVVGGTGAEGSGLALRWAHAGHKVTIGSRDESKARDAAKELNAVLGDERIVGVQNAKGAAEASIVVLTVPYASQVATVSGLKEQLAGKILIDVTVPLVPPKVSTVQLPETDSCVVNIQKMLGASVRVVSAFQNVSAHKLKKLDYAIDCDVLVACDDREAREIGIALAKDAGLARHRRRSARQFRRRREPHLGADLDQPQVQGAGCRHPHHRPRCGSGHELIARRLAAALSAGHSGARGAGKFTQPA